MATTTAAERRALGQWFTAAPVAELAIAALAPIDSRARVIDPTCGDGAFLAAAALTTGNAQAAPILYVANLTGAAENPATGSPGTGFAVRFAASCRSPSRQR